MQPVTTLYQHMNLFFISGIHLLLKISIRKQEIGPGILDEVNSLHGSDENTSRDLLRQWLAKSYLVEDHKFLARLNIEEIDRIINILTSMGLYIPAIQFAETVLSRQKVNNALELKIGEMCARFGDQHRQTADVWREQAHGRGLSNWVQRRDLR